MSSSKLIAARIPVNDYERASRVLTDNNLTVSSAVQSLLKTIAATGEIPEYPQTPAQNTSRKQLDKLMRQVAKRPEITWPKDVSDKDLLGEERMRRFG